MPFTHGGIRFKFRGLILLTMGIVVGVSGCTGSQSASTLPEKFIDIPVSEAANLTANELDSAAYVPQDRYEHAVSVLNLSPEALKPAPSQTPNVGDKFDFYINYDLINDYRQIPTTLQYLSENAAWWVSDDTEVSDADLKAAADNFENVTFQINRLVYGSADQPGIDGTKYIHFLFVNMPAWEGFYGYFSTMNTFPKGMQKYSNEKDMMVINLGSAPLDSLLFAGELGHEFAHMIQWSVDPNESLWMNEALAELSAFLVVSPPIGSLMDEPNQQVFASMPFIQLTARPEGTPDEDPYEDFAHYGGEKLFIVYLLDRFGPLFVKDLIANPEPGMRAINEELEKLDPPLTFDEVYAEWIMALLLNQPDHPTGRFGYKEVETLLPTIYELDQFTGEKLPGYMKPYSAFYYKLQATEKLTLDFKGATMARLTPADPYEGEYAWYSNRGDETSFMLTRSFDLAQVKSATLEYSIWYELEKDFDYAHVLASTDNGKTWDVLPTKYGMAENLGEDVLGIGYTGESGKWRREALDISAYAGKNVTIRFIVNTDLATNRDGIMLDNIAIRQIGYFDGAESSESGWDALGFIRSANIVPVNWIVWLVKVNSDPSLEDEVVRVDLNDLQSAKIEIDGFGKDFDFATIVISPAVPTTTMNTDYEFILTGK